MKRRTAKRKVADKSITEQGKYCGKYALTELLICGECGSPYRRRTWVGNGEKRVYWRCLNRIEHGKKYCNQSIGVEESKLQAAICRGLSKAIPDRKEVYNLIKTNLTFAVSGDDNILDAYAIERKISELNQQAKEMMKLQSRTEGDKKRYDDEIIRTYTEIKSLREQLALANAQIKKSESTAAEVNRITELLDSEELCFSEYDDLTGRRLVDTIRVMHDGTLINVLKGGITITEKIDEESVA